MGVNSLGCEFNVGADSMLAQTHLGANTMWVLNVSADSMWVQTHLGAKPPATTTANFYQC